LCRYAVMPRRKRLVVRQKRALCSRENIVTNIRIKLSDSGETIISRFFRFIKGVFSPVLHTMTKKPFSHNHAIVPLLMLLAAVTIGCSTQKNTARSRWWHSFNARYNTYYNASLAYIDGSIEKEKGNVDNFTEMLPFYTVGNKKSREIGKSNYDRAIEKCQKAIKLHSIKRRPEWNKKRRKTPRDIEWLSRKEYNPFLWKAWMLMGRAQFYSGEFDEAASTFSYMSRLYRTQPSIYGRARAWLAKCYVEQDMIYDAEDVIRNISRDSIHWRAKKEWDFTYADYYIHIKEYGKAIPYVRLAIKHEMRRAQKARLWYLLGQLYAQLGQKAESLRAYKRCIRQNPPYITEFNARLAMAEELSGQGQQKKMISRLRRMARNDNNKDYLDQLYYAIGNIQLSMRDTTSALSSYEKGIAKATRSGIEKGVLLLKAGDVYWEKEQYDDAQRCYGEAIGLLDREREGYEELSYRSKVLDELVPHTSAIHLQDSLLALSVMDEKSRNEAIGRVIEQLKRKEKEEADRLAEANAQAQLSSGDGGFDTQNSSSASSQTQNQSQNGNATWYFYNPTQVAQGKTAFQKQWGKRENVDNWQRINQTVVASDSEEETDSIAQSGGEEEPTDSVSSDNDDPKTDPHKREYYMEQIPFSDEQKAACHDIIKESLFNSGVIFKDKLNNLPLSQKAFDRIETQYPDFGKMADVYYHLFLLYSRKGEYAIADSYVQKLKNYFPTHQWTTLLTDPLFEENARFGRHIEDSLYAATYEAFRANRRADVAAGYHISATRFPLGDNRDKFVFIDGLSKLDAGDTQGCLEAMRTVVEKYPKSSVSEMAGMIINGVKEGRQLTGGHFDMADIWSRRAFEMADSDSINTRTLSAERNTDFAFMIVYQPDSVNENQLLYQLARHNFTSYLVRNFEISLESSQGLRKMTVDGFRNFDESLQYARQLRTATGVNHLLEKARCFVISKENMPLIGTNFSYDEYDDFYNQHFAPLNIETYQLLIEPDELHTRPAEEEKKPTLEEIDEAIDGGMFQNGFDIEPDNDVVQPEGETIVPEEEAPMEREGATISPDDETITPDGTATTPNGETIVPEEEDNAQPIEDKAEPERETIPAESGEEESPSAATSTPIATDGEAEPTVTKTETEPARTPIGSGDDIYFDEEEATTPQETVTKTPLPSNNATQKKQEKAPLDDTDDEYYDLDGF